MKIGNIPEINRNDRLICGLVNDCSTSMTEKNRIAELNQGHIILDQELKSNELTAMRVRLKNYSLGGNNEVISDSKWTDALDYCPPSLVANGWTPLGKAMRQVLHDVIDESQQLRSQGIGSYVPWIFCFCDGMPTDDWENVADECYAATEQGKVIIWPIGIGKGADLNVLQSFSKYPALALNEAKWSELFLWIKDSLQSVAASQPGEMISVPSPDKFIVPA